MSKSSGSVLTVGTFDGVHRGHQLIIQKSCQLAAAKNLTPAALTFNIPPRLFFFPSSEPALLTTLEEKIALLKSFGIKKVIVLKFNDRLANVSAKKFFENFIRKRAHARTVVVGYNFGFGHNREGNTGLLKAMGQSSSVQISIVPPFCHKKVPVSSGRIRDYLKEGQLQEANIFLGYPYFLIGSVVRGDGLGKTIGFPTANISITPEKIVPEGVFAVRVSILNMYNQKSNGSSADGTNGILGKRFRSKDCFFGMANVGYRPTMKNKTARHKRSVEVHLFNFSGSLYEKKLKVEFLMRLRSEIAFKSVEDLKSQLAKDKRLTQLYLKNAKPLFS